MSAKQEVTGEKKQVRIWVDGCFDMMHFGHANALRQVIITLLTLLLGTRIGGLFGCWGSQRCRYFKK
jgi:hypothetical protein